MRWRLPTGGRATEMNRAKLFFPLAMVFLAMSFSPQARAQCSGVNHVTWPAANPVWDFCWNRPSGSSLPQGEGIEITNVKYQGVLILKRAHIPVINVKYIEESGSCGCFRDWLDSEIRFECLP